MELFVKTLTQTDIGKRLSIPTNSLVYLPGLKRKHYVDLKVKDKRRRIWDFRCSIRKTSLYPKPVFISGWLRFVRCNDLRVGDNIIFRMKQQGHTARVAVPYYEVEVQRKIRLLGNEAEAPKNGSDDQRSVHLYMECRRNHGVSFGRNYLDGCGEFMTGNDNAFLCAACGCHRNFHRKELMQTTQLPILAPLPAGTSPLTMTVTPVPLAYYQNGVIGPVTGEGSKGVDSGPKKEDGTDTNKSPKPRRAKLTTEQKAKMTQLAEKLGWRPQRHDDEEIRKFCEENGITRRIFIVWMNNNRRRVRDSEQSEKLTTQSSVHQQLGSN